MAEQNTYKIKDAYPYLKNPQKYVGTRPIRCLSSWEFKLIIKYLDVSDNIVSWKSENTIVKYLNPLTNQYSRYYIDFTLTVRNADGTTKELWVEVKPYKETQVPIPTKNKKNKSYIYQVTTYYRNSAKWDATRKIVEEKKKQGIDVDFVLITEKECPFFITG